ncbi:dickkopf-related protein 3-like [Cherax quadricarinatus]|uniref:dickkopf-related protein 3-like n=1 Tax=Cherax quadricarinatus TaxID=27406 RepID=UPI002378EB5A|nr:dickkopf-related protein 3-like [Cherax quadricarinatus]
MCGFSRWVVMQVWVLVGCCSAATHGLAWLFTPTYQDVPGRHNTRDLNNAHTPVQPYNPYQDLRLCMNDRVCARGEFCDAHYGVCRQRVPEGAACRRDSMCERGMDCMFGTCEARVPRGGEGARCRRERDCDPGMCCARRQGQQVCQRLLQQGDKCYVPEGGPDYAINERCPCQTGLICKYTSPDPPPNDPGIAFWAAYENMKCVPPSHTPRLRS